MIQSLKKLSWGIFRVDEGTQLNIQRIFYSISIKDMASNLKLYSSQMIWLILYWLIYCTTIIVVCSVYLPFARSRMSSSLSCPMRLQIALQNTHCFVTVSFKTASTCNKPMVYSNAHEQDMFKHMNAMRTSVETYMFGLKTCSDYFQGKRDWISLTI